MEISCNLTVVQYCINEYNEFKYKDRDSLHTVCKEQMCMQLNQSDAYKVINSNVKAYVFNHISNIS